MSTSDFLRRLRQASFSLALLGALIASTQAQAHRRDFPFTYEWFQPAQNEKEIELHTFYTDRDHEFEQAIEFEYGISDQWAIAPYIVFEREAGEKLKYHEFKLETRYRIGEYKEGKILPGLYLEYEKPKGEKGEIEAKVILSRYDSTGGNLSLNLITERELESGAKWEKLYSFGYARPLGKSKLNWRGGFEWLHHVTDKRINAGPVVGFEVKNFKIVGGYAFALNKRDGNKGQFRLLTEYEWF